MPSTDPYEGKLFIPSGGPVWHWRALWSQRRWAGFKAELAQHLENWRPPSERLLLFGPSAGWCLPPAFLTRFKSIDAVDIDPLAPLLFRFNHGLALARAGTSLTFHKLNLFSAFDSTLEVFPEHAILFSNVLGQHLFHDEDQARAQASVEAIKSSLFKRYWASFHDRLSGDHPKGKELPAAHSASHAVSSAQLASDFGFSGEWLDHLTVNAMPEGTHRHWMVWPLLDDWTHIVEFGSVAPR